MELIDKLKERFSKSPESFTQWNKEKPIWKDFISKFPSQDITKMSLDDYCMGGKNKQGNFCWWLEVGLEPVFGVYSAGSARSHILFRQKKDGVIYKHRHLKNLSDNDALSYVLKITQFIAEAPNLEKAQECDDNKNIYGALNLEPRVTMGDARKLRVYIAYHPDTVIDINSPRHIEHFLRLFGIKDIANGPFGKTRQLWSVYEDIKKEIDGLTPLGFARLLYDKELGLAPEKDAAEDERDEIMAIDSDAEALPKNVIFYGPPGSGKTYKTVDRALQILDSGFYKENVGNRDQLIRRFNELKEQKRIGFVTFHQSFSYEEFVEGLKAEKDEKDQLVYRVEDGIFKTMSIAAASKVTQSSNTSIDLTDKKVWKVSLGQAIGEDSYIYDECIEHSYILIGFGENLDFSGCTSRKEVEDIYKSKKPDLDSGYPITAMHAFRNLMQEGDIVIVTDGNLKFRAIGRITGGYRILERDDDATYTQCRNVEWLRVYSPSRPKGEITDKTFSQMTVYELKPTTVDRQRLLSLLSETPISSNTFSVGEKISSYFVEKVGKELLSLTKPSGSSLAFSWDMLNKLAQLVEEGKITVEDIKQGRVFDKEDVILEKHTVNGHRNILAPIVQKMTSKKTSLGEGASSTNARVLIIDEINRGNIAKIFGELITLIEDDKRTGKGEGLSADLPYSKEPFSVPDNLYIIGTMNTADRSLTAIDAALRRRFSFEEFVPAPSLLVGIENEDGIEIRRVMEEMNKRIELLLGKEYLIGHSYFLALEDDPSLANIRTLFRSKIIPLLQEYFFDDWGKIHRILGDHQKPEKYQIVCNRFDEGEVLSLLGDDWQGVKENCWAINDNALNEPNAYIGIYKAIK